MIQCLTGHVSGFPAIAEHDNTVRHVEDFIEPVRDEDDPGAIPRDAFDGVKKNSYFTGVERLGRFVQNQHVPAVGPTFQGAGDRDDRPLGRRERLDRHVDIELLAEPANEIQCARPFLPFVERRDGRAALIPGNPQILNSVQFRDQTEVLMNDMQFRFFSVPGGKNYGSTVGCIQTGQDLYQRGLAGTIVTNNRDDLTAVEIHRD
jgi:hypothetical protein